MLILSDWCDTGTGPSEYFRKWLTGPVVDHYGVKSCWSVGANNEDLNQSTKDMFDLLYIDIPKENMGNKGENRQIPDQDFQYPKIPERLKI